jgi:hypothetical protein
MLRKSPLPSAVLLTLVVSTVAAAQGLPTTQPNLLTIVREEVKVGREAEHTRIEAGWPAAYEKAKSPDYYLALVAMTGPLEAWYVATYQSHAALGESMKREDTDTVLGAELARLARADSEVITSVRRMHAAARKELSHGSFPDLAKQRYFEVTWFRVRPGREGDFEAAAKAYGSASDRAGINANYRVYEIMAGVPGPTYLVFSSAVSMSDFDQMITGGEKALKSATAEERAALQKLMTEGVVNVESQRFRVDPVQSYVPKETRAQDPAFWNKKPATKPTMPQ